MVFPTIYVSNIKLLQQSNKNWENIFVTKYILLIF